MDIKPIRSEEDYRAAMQVIERLFDSRPGTPEADQVEVLAILVEDYERRTRPTAQPQPIDAILHEMDRLGLTMKDLEPHIGSRSRVWEVLNRRRRLTLDMIRRLSAALDIPVGILAQDYPLAEPDVTRRIPARPGASRASRGLPAKM